MSLEIYLDPKDPLGYLALQGTAALLANTESTALWLPMQVDSWKEPGPRPNPEADRGARHRWFRAAYRERELRYYAQVQQLPIHGLYRQTDSRQAAMAMLWLSSRQHTNETMLSFLQALTRNYWSAAEQGMDNSQMLPLLKAHDAPGFARFCEQEGPDQLAAQLNRNAELGVIRGPAFRYQEQLFIGREHLPLLAELISE